MATHVDWVRLVEAETDGQLLGALHAQVVLDSLEIIALWVDPACRRRGAARTLLAATFVEARAIGVRSVHLEVCRSNVAARALYAGLAFVQVGVRRGYYARGTCAPATASTADVGQARLDALRLQKRL